LAEKDISDKEESTDREAYQEQKGWYQDKKQCSLLETSRLKKHGMNNLWLLYKNSIGNKLDIHQLIALN
jgi:hypothetical protein